MYIESIQLKDFRNYDSLELKFDRGTNIFYGNNAQGKTNILEAVYLCGTSKSHKGSKDKEIIRFQQEESHIRMMVKKEGVSYKIDMHLKKNRAKGVAINGIPIKKARELLGVVNLVFFSPEDLNIIENGPAERRRFLDLELCQLDNIYLSDLAAYNHIVNQRNRLLKDCQNRAELNEMLDLWDMQLIQYGSRIMERREKFLEEVNEITITISYEKNIGQMEFESVLKKNRERDIRMKSTSAGPHRDDICFLTKDIDIRKFGSQGQQRTAALSLKLSEIEIVRKLIKDTPVLLLDDVLSELDKNRQNYLLDSIHDIQTLITCTGVDEFVNHRFSINKIFHVSNGVVVKEN